MATGCASNGFARCFSRRSKWDEVEGCLSHAAFVGVVAKRHKKGRDTNAIPDWVEEFVTVLKKQRISATDISCQAADEVSAIPTRMSLKQINTTS